MSQLSSAEEHANEFYKAGLGLSPADLQTMTAQEKLSGLIVHCRQSTNLLQQIRTPPQASAPKSPRDGPSTFQRLLEDGIDLLTPLGASGNFHQG